MIDFIEYLFGEVKKRAISELDALDLLEQFQGSVPLAKTYVHPLLQRNTSSLEEQRFSSTFRGDEFYLSDHVVKGRKVLPGVCYLEMARAAVECSSGFEVGVSMRVELRDVIWSRPVVVTGSKDVHIGLYSNERGEIEFEIYSAVAEMEKGAKDACGEVKEEDEFIHSQGRAVLLEVTAEVERIDVDALRSRCDQEVDVSACYAAFSAMGIEYGAAHRGLVSMQVGKDKDGQPIALAHLHLPSSVSVTAEHYVLHPSVMDSALQASLGLSFINMDATLASNKLIRPSLPFALDRLEIIDRSPVDAWAVVRPRAGVGVNQSSIGGVHKLDIDICDESGRLCVRLKGFTSRVLAGELQSATSLVASETQVEQLEDEAKAIEALTGAVLLVPRWEATVPQTNTMWPAAESRVLLMGGTEAQHRVWRERYPQLHLLSMDAALSVEVIAEFVQALGDIDHVVWLSPAGQLGSPTDERLIKAQALRVIGLYRSIKALLSLDYGVRALGLSVVTWQTQAISCSERTDPAYASVHGLIGSLAKEYANWQVRLVDLPIESDDAQAQSLLEEVLRLPADPQGNAWVYRAEEWYRQQLIPCVFQQSPEPQYRTGGLYVVIGGAGGIGEAFSEYLIKKYQARMIWIGRRELDAVIQAKIDSLSAWGPAPVYLCADATNREALEHAYQTIRSQHGGIHGVVHAAIELLDKSLAQMDEARFKASLAAKVDVSVRMAQVFAGEPLDWVLFFSSLQSFAKAAGQSNYAAGCTFKDAFAHELGHAWPCPVRVMSWGYWGSVGIVASGDYRARMAQYGINSIEPAEGMVALENLLSGPASQLVFLKTARPQALTGLAEVHERITLAGEHAPSLLTSLSQSTARIFAQEHTDARIAVAQNDFQQLLGRVLFSQLQSLGLFTEVNASIVMWQQQVNLSATYSRWLKESIRILESAGYITVKDDICTVKHPGLLDAAAVWAEWDERTREWLKDPSLSAQVKIAAATMRALPEILTGKRLATDILFPNSSMALVQEIYKNNALADYFNAVLADTVVEYVAQRCKQNPATRLRILEIGAGTGGTSECVLRQLKPYQQSIAEYCYTDISKAFLMHAEQAYGPTTPYLTYKLFNVEQSLKLQGIENGTYDVVIATNVLHATKNIRYTLRNAKAALKRHGMLVLNEISGRSLFAHLTFGLLEGWWLYEDSTVRIPGTPAVSAKTWQRLLEGEGFQSIAFPANAFHEHGQQIIVTESDGVIRQQVQARNSDRVAVRRAGVFQDKGAQSEQKQAKRSAVVIAKNTVTAVRSDEFRHSNENATLRERAITALKKLVGQTLKVPMQHLDESESLKMYGIDSILVVNLANGLKRFFPDLSSTLFFEHQTIAALVAHFIQTERAAVGRWVGLKDPAGSVSSNEVESSHDQREADASETTSARLTLPMRRRGRRALLSVQTEARAESIESSVASAQDIAIIGLSGRYPQAKNVQEFWENLKAGKNCISEIPQARWDHRRYFDAEKGKPGKSYSKWGGFIADVDQFDPLFFRISPKEAEQMDPQERLFLQEAYASIEDAGYTPATLCVSKKVGVYVGVINSTYFKQSNYWSIANRVSYLCDFQGPSMAVDTACSSSLTAIHLAIESIYSGTCECAIAGGVNLIIDPIQYTNLSAMMMLSSDGRCKAFGDQADGFVDGEGVGAVVLKPIEKAILAGDHIYGVIKSSTVNAGGKTNGYTVPNPIAQRELIQAALSKANVDPRTVSYIEAHGTGTELGDPIEISGLSKAFQVGTQDKQFCAIGSAKSNIGHCESAAGIAGLTKVLLQLKYRTLVPSLHSQVLNPHIDFANSPFVVQRELGEWKRPVLGEGAQRKEYPRIAGISAFGAGGSNAHVVIEEYVDQRGVVAGAVVSANRPAIIVLSAKDEARLKERVEQLLSALGGGEYGEGDLAAIAYTLQLGREAMEQRLALSVVSLSELREKLQRWISGEEGIEELYRGEVKSNKETLVLFTADEDLQKAIGAWIEKGKYSKLLDLWVKGLVFDWHSVHGENKPRRIPLPTYPFAKERYWAELALAEESSLPARGSAGLMAVLHPLAQRNTSNLSEQRYSTTFSGEEFFLSDHRVGGKGILPGVAYLEMARAAMSLSIEGEAELQGAGICLENVVWSRPLVVEGSTEIHIRVCPSERGGMDYEVYSAVAVSDGGAAGEGAAESQEIIYSQGHGLMTSVPSAEQLDCAHLQAGCDRQVAVSDCYEVFQHTGLEYGESHRGLTSVSVGSDSEGERYVLAEVKLPGCVLDVRAGYVLHPSVMDSALQAGIGLVLGSESVGEGGRKAALPFALERLEIFANSPVEGYVYVRRSPSEGHSGVEETLQKLDIDVCDKQGRVCVRLQGLTSRVLTDSAVQSADQDQGMVLLSPCYRALSGEAVEVKYSQQHVVVCGGSVEFQSRLQGSVGGVRCVSAVSSTSESGSSELGARYSECVEAVFEVIQGIVQGKPREEVLLQVVVVKDEASEVLSGLSGLLKTASIEQPKLATQLIEVSASESVAQVLQKLTQNQGYGSDRLIRYEGEVRQVGSFAELVRSGSSEEIPWRSDGVYLITGGVGGLGIIFGAEILSRMPTATVILTGRSALSAEKQSQLDQLRLQGGRIDYLAMDVSEAESVQSGMQEIATKYGLLRGVIHSAGVLRDNYLIKKSVAELRAVLAPKVTGLVHLDEATAQLELDFVVVFSSVAGVFGNAGQGDYASANAFMDQYMEYRRKLVKSGARHGRSVSINWPLWQMGGMQVDAATEQMMSSVGMSPLSSEQGLQAFYTALHSEVSQVVVLAGDRRRLLSRVLGLPAAKAKVAKVAVVAAPLSAVSSAVSAEALDSKAIHYFKKLLASHLKMPIDRLEEDAPFEKYGIDSILVMQMTNELEKSFGSLSKTLLFEYQDIQSLSDYFVESHREQLIKLLGLETGESAVAVEHSAVSQARVSAVAAMGKGHRARYGTLRAVVSEKKVSRDIAIIGLSGRYPQANNVAAFWENLKAGKDSITEIPQSRWDHSIYYDPQKGKFGKSYSKWGGFIDGVDQFDPLFFNISPRDALGMDPQERLFLQCVYETLEDAGYTREALKQYRALGLEGNVGVFVGVMYEEYQLYGAQAQMLGQAYALGGNPSSIANRVSYFCNFHGPSMAVDTMCSSSLTSIHLACQSLINSGCEVAIAGGVNISVHPNKYLTLSQGQFASSTGRCESFGEGGDGYVPGEGVGAVLLKPLSGAIADNDYIYGVIKGTSINHGGKTNGYTVPNPKAQMQVIEQALKEAGVNARAVSYIEAHGTGTSLGDPIEISGLSKAFQVGTQDKQFCAIGSAKSNIGHCESAAGIAGLTKVLLQLKYRTLVPSLHSQVLNPHIDFANSPFVVQRELGEWKRPVLGEGAQRKEYPRIAGISAFGAGGSNAHVVIEEYVDQRGVVAGAVVSANRPAIIVLSAKDEARLKERVEQLLSALGGGEYGEGDLAAIAYTLQLGREAMEQRLALSVVSLSELREKLQRWISGEEGIEELYRGEVKSNKETLVLFTADEDLQKAIGAWIEKGKYSKLLDLWVKGLVFDWHSVHGENKPRRIPLPTYPFAKERYWLETRQLKPSLVRIDEWPSPSAVEHPSDEAAQQPIKRPVDRIARYLNKKWKPAAVKQGSHSYKCVVILATAETGNLATALSKTFAKSHILNASSDNLTETIKHITWPDCDAWVDLVGCGTETSNSTTWINAFQQWIENGPRTGMTALCFTTNLESFQNVKINLSGADRVALYRMLQSEYGWIRSRHVDLDAATNGAESLNIIVQELNTESDELEICYREATNRYRVQLLDMPLEAKMPFKFAAFDRVLWVTGGTRGIGYLCAQHFIERHGATKVVLSGREKLPPQTEWPLYEHQETEIARKIRSIRLLQKVGVEIYVSNVSLADQQALQREVEYIEAHLGQIGGVLHCAGTFDVENAAFIRKSGQNIQDVFEPKIAGLNNLLAAIKGQPLQFVVLFSSVAAIIPTLAVGQSTYSAANSYMDYVAEAYAQRLPIMSIQWGNWKESGYGEVKSDAYLRTGFLSHTNSEGLQFLDKILVEKNAHVILPVIVNDAGWSSDDLLLRSLRERNKTNGNSPLGESKRAKRAPKPVRSATKEWLLTLIAAELKIDATKMDVEKPLADYGVESVMMVQLLKPIGRYVGSKIDPSIFFEYATIGGCADWLADTYTSAFAGLLANPTPDTDFIAAALPAARNDQTRHDNHRAAATDVRPSADIAVVGMACRFGGARDLSQFWSLLSAGGIGIDAVSKARSGSDAVYYAGLLENVGHFDRAFFHVSASDAATMDPQAFMVLEECVNAVHHAGYSLAEIKGSNIGVFLGARSQSAPYQQGVTPLMGSIMAIGQNYLAANVSRFMDLHGPSLVIDSACSSALTAIDLAANALLMGEIDAAMAGGVSLLGSDAAFRIFASRGILSNDHNFHIFDRRANGVVLGEGVGMVLLKTLKKAQQDGDFIYAVVKAVATNNDGRTSGPAAPNFQSQKEVMRKTLRKSGRLPEDISYIEVSGSGSEVTDLLELKAIEAVYRPTGGAACALGSTKPNIGHSLCAQGIASFIKVVLMLQKKKWAPFISAIEPMTHYDFTQSPFMFHRVAIDISINTSAAAINCFADGGTNAHVIMERYELEDSANGVRTPIGPPEWHRVNTRSGLDCTIQIGSLIQPESEVTLASENDFRNNRYETPHEQNLWHISTTM